MAQGRDRAPDWIEAYRQRLKRRQLLWRGWRARHRLRPLADRSAAIRPGDILCLATMRNEALRLPHFLDHHRRLGVNHFLMVDNASQDGSAELAMAAPDVSVWQTADSYRDSRFGMDWLNGLLLRHGHGHWCLTLDLDELFVFPGIETHGLRQLTDWLQARGLAAMAAMMIELYPKGPLSLARYASGQDPVAALPWFDAGPYRRQQQPRYGNLSIRGGVRERMFFAQAPELAPHLHKTPLVHWHWRYAYLSATHIALPRRLNDGFGDPTRPTGALLHTKFLPDARARAAEEKGRGEHFTHAGRYAAYYDAILADPDLWHPGATPYQDGRQLVDLGLMQPGEWPGQPGPA